MHALKRLSLATLILGFAQLALPGMAHADCANPSAPAAVIFFNQDHCILQYCNGTNWIGLGATDPAACGCPSTGLVSHWALDESSGTTASDSAGSNDGTLTNMDPATDWVAGKLSNALDFDGTDDFVDIADNDSLDPGNGSLTVSAWVKTSTNVMVVSKDVSGIDPFDNTAGYSFYIRTSNPYVRMTVEDGEGNYAHQASASTDVRDGQWHHVVGRWDAGTKTVTSFIDGVQQGSTTNTNIGDISNAANLYISSFVQDGSRYNYFNGLIDDVRIYDRALTAQEISDLHNGGAGC